MRRIYLLRAKRFGAKTSLNKLESTVIKTIARAIDPEQDAIDLLKADHRKVESLFSDFEKADKRSKLRIAREICAELEVHAKIEETVFYPAAKKEAKKSTDMVNEGIVEHEGIKRLVKLIPTLTASDEFFETRVKVLKEYVTHHVKEEEKSMFPAIVESDVDLKAIGAKLALAKKRLQNAPTSRAA